VDEQLEVAYIELYGYVPSLQKTFDKTIQEIKNAEIEVHQATISALQDVLPKNIDFADQHNVGNKFRSVAEQQREQLRSKIEAIATPLREKMLNLIHLSDEAILQEASREAAMRVKSGGSADSGRN